MVLIFFMNIIAKLHVKRLSVVAVLGRIFALEGVLHCAKLNACFLRQNGARCRHRYSVRRMYRTQPCELHNGHCS